MKYISLLLALSIGLTFFNCNDGDDGDSNQAELFYDNGSSSAPFFNEGTHEAAVRFPRSIMSNFTEQTLDRVDFYLVNVPNNCVVKVYNEGTDQGPGLLLYEADISTTVRGRSWNTHELTESLVLTGNELWLSIEITLDERSNTIGCDIGPAVDNGDWVSADGELGWSSYRDFTDDAVDINWNIRGVVE